MNIGIKYCGGCNPRYQRIREVAKLKTKLSEMQKIKVEYTEGSDVICDYWIVVCGCATACADTQQLKARYEVIEVSQPKDFVGIQKKIVQTLERESASKDIEQRACYIGEKASISKVLDEEAIMSFAQISGDNSWMHIDKSQARKGLYHRPVAHGVLVGSLISSAMGTKLPGPGTILMEFHLTCRNPIYWDETVTAEVTFVGYEEHAHYYIGDFYGCCKNQDNIIVAEAECKQMMMKKLFIVKEEKNDEPRKVQ